MSFGIERAPWPSRQNRAEWLHTDVGCIAWHICVGFTPRTRRRDQYLENSFQGARGRGPGAGRQVLAILPRSACARAHRLHRAPRVDTVDDPDSSPGTTSWTPGAGTGLPRRHRPLLDEAGPTTCLSDLHIGHHRRPQGRHAHHGQSRLRHRADHERGRTDPAAGRAQRPPRLLPAALSHLREGLLGADRHRRRVDRPFRRVPGHADHRPARGAAHDHAGSPIWERIHAASMVRMAPPPRSSGSTPASGRAATSAPPR